MLVETDNLITQTVAAKLRGVTTPAIRYLVQTKRLRSVEICGTVYVFRSEVLAYRPGARQQVRKLSDDEVLQDVVRVAKQIGHIPSSYEYQRYGRISASTLCKRFKSWSMVCRAIRRKIR